MTNLVSLVRDGNLKYKMTAAVCARDSASPGLMGHKSLQEQIDTGCEFARKFGYCVPKEYIFAEKASGRDPERTKLLSLLNLVDRGRIDSVVVKDPSRLSRDISTLLMVSKKCEEKGVRLLITAG